jgi:hypothetical protein
MRKFTFSLPSNLLILALFALNIFSFESYAQVGIGTTTPQAMLDVVASDPDNPTAKDGFLMPRVTSLSQDFQSTATGTMVFYSGSTGVGNGNMKNTVYFYDGTNWKNMSGEIASTADPYSLYDYDSTNKGVVFWIDPDDPYHYKIVSPVEFTSVKYGDTSGAAACTAHACVMSDIGGFERTKAWNTAHSGVSSSDYGSYANSATYYFNGVDGVGTTALGWHTPSSADMYLLYNNRTSINNEFAAEGLTHNDIGTNMGYWVCEDSYLNGVNVDQAVQSYNGLVIDWDKTSNASNDAVRIVKEIGG